MSNYLHKGFTFQTNKAAYRCNYEGFEVGAEKWIVDIRFVSSEVQIGRFELPANWARTRVFQFLNDMDEGKQSMVDYQEEVIADLRGRLREAEEKLAAAPLEKEGRGNA